MQLEAINKQFSTKVALISLAVQHNLLKLYGLYDTNWKVVGVPYMSNEIVVLLLKGNHI